MTKKTVVNGITGETVVRDMTLAELDLVKLDEAEAKAQAKIVADKAKAKQAVLDRLGITDDEARMLLS